MSAKERTPIAPEVAASVLFAAHRTCCKCCQPGRTLQIHHIDDDPSNNALSNLAVLCLECHNETQLHGGFGRRLSAGEVTKYRDDWIARVSQRRDAADALAAAAMSSSTSEAIAQIRSASYWALPEVRAPFPSRAGLEEYIRILPDFRRRAYLLMHVQKPITTIQTVEAYLGLQDVLTNALVTLLSYYPPEHFSSGGPDQYVSEVVAERTHWHYLRTSSDGVGNSGSLAQTRTAVAIVQDLERMIDETVSTLTGTDLREPDEGEAAWHRAWCREVPWSDPDA